MIVYSIITAFHLLEVIVHKRKEHRDDACILFYPRFLEPTIKRCDELVKQTFHKSVLFNSVVRGNGEASALEEMVRSFDDLLENEAIDLRQSEIYVAGAQASFGIYVAHQEIEFNCFEEASGTISRPDALEQLVASIGLDERHNLAKEYRLYDGSCKYITANIINMDCQEDGFIPPENAVHFDVVKELGNLDAATRESIIKAFASDNMDKIESHYDCVLLTQHFANLNLLPVEEQITIYQILVDYFLQNQKVLIKPHPEDLLYYNLLFPKADLITDRFPSEFLPFMFANKPALLATVSSTATRPLKGIFNKVLEFGILFEKEFNLTHRYFVAIDLATKCKKPICFIGANKKLVENLFEFSGFVGEYCFAKEFLGEEGYVYVIDKHTADQTQERFDFVDSISNKNSDIIFINSNNNFVFYDYYHKNVFENIVPITLRYKKTREEDCYANLNEEIIYFYSKEGNALEMAKKYEIAKDLPNTGIELSVEPINEEEMKIKRLEGILRATERRLLYYIEKEKEEASK